MDDDVEHEDEAAAPATGWAMNLRALGPRIGQGLRALPHQATSSRWRLLTTIAVLGVGAFVLTTLVSSPPHPPLPPQPEEDTSTTEVDAASSRVGVPPTLAPTTTVVQEGASSKFLEQVAEVPGPPPLDSYCQNPVTISAPASDLANTVANAAPGTCFKLQPGEYRFRDVVPKDGMTFLGTDRGSVAVVGSGDAENAFHGTATGVTIGRMTFKGFQGTGGQKPQQQAPIRGSAGIWKTEPGQLASEWLIEDIEASGNYALGLFIGNRFTVRNSTFANNGVAGIGGSETTGGLIEGNVVTGNGDRQLQGYEANGGGMKFTEAAGGDSPLVIHRNEIHGNKGVGVWCDIGCTGFHVIDNYIHDQDSHGVMFELSSNALIKGNLIVNANTWSDFSRDFNAGAITVGESSGVTIEGNYVDGAKAGVVVRQTRRPVLPQEQFLYNYPTVNWTSGDIHVKNNVIVNTKAMGISTGKTGGGLISNPGSIRYEANTYGNPGSMEFFWDGGYRYNYQEWQASGRDHGAQAQAPARPAWTTLSS